MSKRHQVIGGNGLVLAVHEFGDPDGPAVLLVPGFTQSYLCWAKQYESEALSHCRILAMDLRGHGDSEKPLEIENYTNGQLWADDVDAIITQLNLTKPVVVVWSYGGLVICDYVQRYGDRKLGGVHFVTSCVKLAKDGDMIGPGFLGNITAMVDANLATQVSGVRKFLRSCYAIQPSQDDFETIIAYSMSVPSAVRRGLVVRNLAFGEVIASISVPVLVTIGDKDTILRPEMSEYILAHAPSANVSRYPDAGHVPFAEDHKRFNAELVEFVHCVSVR
jgi:non-heme chloroperoxidase